jgi:hypothetical protein
MVKEICDAVSKYAHKENIVEKRDCNWNFISVQAKIGC